MKWFYIVAAALVALMVSSPFVLLRSAGDTTFDGVIGYNTYGSKVKSVDPATCGDTTSSAIQGSIYEGLYGYHYLKRPIQVVPYLAEGMPEISEDGLTVTVRIRKDIRYSPNRCFGKDPADKGKWATRNVTADDFVLAFKRIGDFHVNTDLSLAFIEDKIVGLKEYAERTRVYREGDFSRYDKEDLPGVKALDKHTIQFKLTKPFPQFPYVLAMHVYAPIPREVIDCHLAGGDNPIPIERRHAEILRREAVVGTGPYVLSEWVKGNKIILTRNPEFRKVGYPTEGGPGDRKAGLLADAGKPIPFVDQWRLTYVAESNTAWMMFDKMLRDTAGIPRDQFDKVISLERDLVKSWGERGVRLIKEPYPVVYWYVFNMEDEVLGASKSLRQALQLSFNVEEYIDVMYNGRAIRAVNAVPSTFKGHKEAGPSPYAVYDVALAKKKVAAAKKELIAAGVIKAGEEIPPLTIDMPSRDEQARRTGVFIQRQFERIGMKVKVEMNDWPTLQRKVHNKMVQMYAMGWHADYPDAENFLQLYYSPNIDRGTNNANYKNEEFDRLFKMAETVMDEEKRVPLYAQMIRILNEDCPVLLLTEPISYVLINDWVSNNKLHPIGYGFRRYIRLDTAARRKRGGR